MADFPSWDTLFRIERDEALVRNARLSRDVVERDGTDANVLLAAAAAAGEEVVAQLADAAAGLFLGSAKGQALDRLAYDRYGLTRKPAAPALGTVEFSLAAPNPVAFAIPVGTLLRTTDGLKFATTAASVFPAGAVGPIPVAVQSTLAGLAQQVGAGTITSITTVPPGAAVGLTVTNPLATAGAADGETDTALRERARSYWGTVQLGTLAAIEQAARAVPGVSTARADEGVDATGAPGRYVMLYLTDELTQVLVDLAPTPPVYAAQAQALAAAVETALRTTRAGGIQVIAQVAQVTLLPVVLQLVFEASADPEETTAAARAAMVLYAQGLAPGRPWLRDAARAWLLAVPGLLDGTDVATPAGDVVAATMEALRTPIDLVTTA